jgi:uncharacterized membrane protein HdeD (DUF308 family)
VTYQGQADRDIQVANSSSLAEYWRPFLIEGAILIILGILAIAVPAVATLAIDIYLGWLFLIAGIAGFFAVFSVQDIASFLLSLIPAILSIIIGGLLLRKPAEGALSLTALMVIVFAAEGLFQIVSSIAYRNYMQNSWGWILLSGIADLVLAGIIIYGWPITANWVLGVLAGVNLITSGLAVVIGGSRWAQSRQARWGFGA